MPAERDELPPRFRYVVRQLPTPHASRIRVVSTARYTINLDDATRSDRNGLYLWSIVTERALRGVGELVHPGHLVRVLAHVPHLPQYLTIRFSRI